jgi:chromosome segregation protein
MKLTKLRLLGFKSFVEATDVLIEPGLTGIVGPNGCGKSNLVEALRWVMGESSHKNLRAAEMDDVIFSGSGGRPARNTAEVVLIIENSDRTAPAAFNDADLLEISRRIERDRGSTYKINGREVRARDVQLIFADASTGARSPALVRQGQIAELIAAKPQARRRILEEAAGISGLHTRRHEAELRLNSAEHNLERLEDVLSQIEMQLEGLKRQSRQAARYRLLSARIRKAEALLFHLAFVEAGRQVIEAEERLTADLRLVAERSRAEAQATRLAAGAAQDLPARRETEAAAAAVLQRLAHAREALDKEERRAGERLDELDRRIAQASADVTREQAIVADAGTVLERLAAERTRLMQETDSFGEDTEAAQRRLVALEAGLAQSEAQAEKAQAALAEGQARRAQAEQTARDTAARLVRLEGEAAAIATEHSQIAADSDGATAPEVLRQDLHEAQERLRRAEEETVAAEARQGRTRQAEAALRLPLQEAERLATRLEAEVSMLRAWLAPPGSATFPPVEGALSVAPGFEAALGAALGDDLAAPVDTRAAAHWTGAEPRPDDPALPAGVEPLGRHVEAPQALRRRLAQIGLVARSEGPHLAARLATGQRLVSREGDLWRWDGFTASADAPSATARRLAERNRLSELENGATAARRAAGEARLASQEAESALRRAGEEERLAREAWRAAARLSEDRRDRLAEAERSAARRAARLSALAERAARLATDQLEAAAAKDAAEAAVATMPDVGDLSAQFAALRAQLALQRSDTAEARAMVQSLAREAEARSRRLAAIAVEQDSWAQRRSGGTAQIETLASRLAEFAAERAALAQAPGAFAEKRSALLSETTEAEARRRAAADRLVEAETRLAEADRQCREAAVALAAAREAHIRIEERLEGLRARRAGIAHEIQDRLDVAPSAVLRIAGIDSRDPLPDRQVVERDLEEARRERERLGAVNLRAEEELAEVQAELDRLVAERDDLIEAIKRLRQAIATLNREGRERLLAAFDIVNRHFQELFATLFDGGTAELQLTESEDPLEAGLDILARPPGKKPQTLSLLSGGEQALTAMALIFAVFLTNPAPICVLDEVDAPLDDSNVERFCDLLDEMTRRTETRFVTITHNPITMARMNRLFGVTMAERGVSQLVSVDLVEAEGLREAV